MTLLLISACEIYLDVFFSRFPIEWLLNGSVEIVSAVSTSAILVTTKDMSLRHAVVLTSEENTHLVRLRVGCETICALAR